MLKYTATATVPWTVNTAVRGQSMLQRTVNTAQWVGSPNAVQPAASCHACQGGREVTAAVPRPRVDLAHLPDWIALLTFCGKQTTIWSCSLSWVEQAWQKNASEVKAIRRNRVVSSPHATERVAPNCACQTSYRHFSRLLVSIFVTSEVGVERKIEARCSSSP
jgi:hypothetical protein